MVILCHPECFKLVLMVSEMVTKAPVKWESPFMSKLFAGTMHTGIFFLSCFPFWKFGLKLGRIGPWPKPQRACGPFDLWPPGGGLIYCRSLIGDRRNSVYAWTLEVWERKGRMGRAKHTSEKGTGGASHDLSHYCVLPFPSFLFSLKLLEFKHNLNFFGPLLLP